jgi:uncharacterized cupin superfamily protein
MAGSSSTSARLRGPTSDKFRSACIFEGDEARFSDIGFTLAVIEPGRPSGLYHAESNQEDFLVLGASAYRSWKARNGR